MILFANRLRFRSQMVALVAIIAFLESCSDKSDVAVVLPGNPCEPAFSYGYTEKTSYLPGDKMKVYMQAVKRTELCRLDVYTITGSIAFSVPASLFVQQVSGNEPAVNGYGFTIESEVELPVNLKSGIYLIEKQIPFIVKTTHPVDMVVLYPLNTVNAYGKAGGRSLYDKTDRPSHVSFHRPLELQSQTVDGLKWLATLSNYSIGYVADYDIDDYSSIQQAQILVIVGHNEYWTRKARRNFDRFVDEGKDALILSGNTMWWQVRYTDHQMICHKDATLDPMSDLLMKTILWEDRSLEYPILSSIGADFSHGGYGRQGDNGWDGYKIVSPTSPLLEGLNLQKGDILSLPSGEYDGAPILNFTSSGYPVLDKAALNFHQIELIGFDLGARGGKETVGTFIAFRKTSVSGVVVNMASYDWCSENGMGGTDGEKLKKITLNAIERLLKDKSVFSN